MLKLLRGVGRDVAGIYDLARKEKLLVLASILAGITLLGATVFYLAERGSNPVVNSIWDGLYWALVTVVTVGYGDVHPTTTLGRVAAAVTMLSFFVAMPIVMAIVTTIYVSKRIRGESGLDKVSTEGHVVICGWNNTGNNILAGLEERNENLPIVVVGELAEGHFEDLEERFPSLKLFYVRGPFNHEGTLQRANVNTARVAIVLASYSFDSTSRSDDLAVLCVLALRELGPQLRIVAECFASANRQHLRRAGADRVVVSGELDGYLLTAASLSPGLDLAMKDALTFGSSGGIWTKQIPQEFVGRTFKDLAQGWLNDRNWVVLGLVQRQAKLGISEVLAGDKGSIDEFIMRRFQQAGRVREGTQALHYLNPGPKHLIRAGDQAIVIFPEEQHVQQ